jgi:membrane fusion protein, multidrug efflux system
MNILSDKKNLVFRATVATSVFLALVVLVYWYWIASKRITTENAYIDAEILPVNSRMMGYVKEVYVKENQQVKKGQLLLKLDDSDTKIELSFKTAKLKKAEADFKRAAVMWKNKGISDSDYELAEATVIGHRADYEGSKLKLSFTEIVAPIDGIIAKRSAQPGEFVQPGQSLFVVVPLDELWIRANFKESQIRFLKIGQRVEVEVDAYPDHAWHGKVESIYPSTVASLSLLPPENTTGNFTKVVQRFAVKISLEQDKEKMLRPGMSVVPKVFAD